MAYVWVSQTVSLQFIGGVANCAVHVLMYAYFLQKSLRPPPAPAPRWKALVTGAQLLQFSLSFSCFCVTAFLVFYEGMECAGFGWLAAQAGFNAVLFGGFLGIFKRTVAGGEKKD